MAQVRKLSNPPITEALIDIQVEPVSSLTVSLIEEAYSTFSDRYPNKRSLKSGSLKFKMDVEHGPSTETIDEGLVGYHFLSQKEDKIIQFRQNGFTFNRLAPYDNWGSIVDEVKTYWPIFKTTINPVIIKRIALRYINRIEIPLGAELSKYFYGAPIIPEGLPKSIEKFITRTTVKDSEINLSANITLAYEGVNKYKKASILLDIDVFEVLNIDIKEDENLWVKFDKFHDFKNNIFFKSVTDKALEPYS